MGRYQKYQRKLKYITVLGSTGSIGTQTLEIASEQPDKFKAVALSAGRNINLLTEQVKTYKPEVVAIEDESLIEDLKDNICLLYTSPSPRDATLSRMPSSA